MRLQRLRELATWWERSKDLAEPRENAQPNLQNLYEVADMLPAFVNLVELIDELDYLVTLVEKLDEVRRPISLSTAEIETAALANVKRHDGHLYANDQYGKSQTLDDDQVLDVLRASGLIAVARGAP